MKKIKLTQNIGLKVMAFLFAVLLWLVVVNIADPVVSATYTNIPVTVVNEQVVTNEGKVYRILDETQTVRVTVYAKRSVLGKITSDNIVATADLSQMELNSLVPITATIRDFEGKYQSTEVNPHNLSVKVEDVTKNTFPISVSTTGDTRDGYVVGELTANPEKITISGSESLIESIQKVVARVDVSGMSESAVKEADLILIDGNGNSMDQSRLSNNLGEKELSVNVEILSKKDVNLEFSVSGTPEEGHVYTGWSSVPERVQVCGSKEVLENLTAIEIPASEIDITGESKRKEVTVDILPYLPEGVQLVDESASNVVVTVGIEQEGTRTIEFPLEGIKVNNLNENLMIAFESQEDLELQFTGAEDALKVLDVRNAVSVDLKNYTAPGTYEIEVDVVTDSNVILKSSPKVKVILTEKEGEKEEE